MKSPCILVCSIDMETGYCFGCGRTGEEIRLWINYTDAERDFVMAALPERLKVIKRKPRRDTRRSRMARERAEALVTGKDRQF
ncbi:MAG: DUF1289 domain-containing protein [Nitratireductor sp.]